MAVADPVMLVKLLYRNGKCNKSGRIISEMCLPISQNTCVSHTNYTHSYIFKNKFELEISSVIFDLWSISTDFFVNGTLARCSLLENIFKTGSLVPQTGILETEIYGVEGKTNKLQKYTMKEMLFKFNTGM